MNFAQAVASGFRKSTQFHGRSSRSEYWYWVLFLVIAILPVALIDTYLYINYEDYLTYYFFDIISYIPDFDRLVIGFNDGDVWAYFFGSDDVSSDVVPFGLSTYISIFVFSLISISMSTRRLHDLNHSGWWQLMLLSDFGAWALTIYFCFRGTKGMNRFGPDPLAD